MIRKPLAQIVFQVERVVSEQDGAHAAPAPRDEHGAESAFSGGKQNLSVHGATLSAARSFGAPVLADLASLPGAVFFRHADCARPVARGARRALVEEEHALTDVAAARDCAQRGGAVQAPVDPSAAVASERSPPTARVRRSVGAYERPGLALRRYYSERVLYSSAVAITYWSTSLCH